MKTIGTPCKESMQKAIKTTGMFAHPTPLQSPLTEESLRSLLPQTKQPNNEGFGNNKRNINPFETMASKLYRWNFEIHFLASIEILAALSTPSQRSTIKLQFNECTVPFNHHKSLKIINHSISIIVCRSKVKNLVNTP